MDLPSGTGVIDCCMLAFFVSQKVGSASSRQLSSFRRLLLSSAWIDEMPEILVVTGLKWQRKGILPHLCTAITSKWGPAFSGFSLPPGPWLVITSSSPCVSAFSFCLDFAFFTALPSLRLVPDAIILRLWVCGLGLGCRASASSESSSSSFLSQSILWVSTRESESFKLLSLVPSNMASEDFIWGLKGMIGMNKLDGFTVPMLGSSKSWPAWVLGEATTVAPSGLKSSTRGRCRGTQKVRYGVG